MHSNSREACPYTCTSLEAKPVPELGCLESSPSALPATLPFLRENTECSDLSEHHCFQRQFASMSFPVKRTILLALWVRCHPPMGCLPQSHLTPTQVLHAAALPNAVPQPLQRERWRWSLVPINAEAHVVGDNILPSGEKLNLHVLVNTRQL